MEQTKKFAEGIFVTKKKNKTGDHLEISLKQQDGSYKKYVAFESKKLDKFNNVIYSVFDKIVTESKTTDQGTDLPF